MYRPRGPHLKHIGSSPSFCEAVTPVKGLKPTPKHMVWFELGDKLADCPLGNAQLNFFIFGFLFVNMQRKKDIYAIAGKSARYK